MTASCENGNEHSGYINAGNIFCDSATLGFPRRIRFHGDRAIYVIACFIKCLENVPILQGLLPLLVDKVISSLQHLPQLPVPTGKHTEPVKAIYVRSTPQSQLLNCDCS
jgi:hypothetical protein